MVTSGPAPGYLLRDGSFPSYNSHHSGDEPLAKRCSGKGPAHALCCWWEPRSRVGRDPVGAGQSAELYAWSTHKCSQSPEGKPSPAAAHAIKPPHIFKRISGLWMMGWKHLKYIQPRGPNPHSTAPWSAYWCYSSSNTRHLVFLHHRAGRISA